MTQLVALLQFAPVQRGLFALALGAIGLPVVGVVMPCHATVRVPPMVLPLVRAAFSLPPGCSKAASAKACATTRASRHLTLAAV